MRIAVVIDRSGAARAADVVAAPEGRGHEIFNAGMEGKDGEAPLSYVQTGLISALLLHLERADFVVGGCGSGQGYLNAVLQYPGVFCGLIRSPLDAWLFTQINGGNCVSLPLGLGYGFAADVNLRFVFDRLFEVASGSGYPAHRGEGQRRALRLLEEVSQESHRPFAEIVRRLPAELVGPALRYPGVWEYLAVEGIADEALRDALQERYDG